MFRYNKANPFQLMFRGLKKGNKWTVLDGKTEINTGWYEKDFNLTELGLEGDLSKEEVEYIKKRLFKQINMELQGENKFISGEDYYLIEPLKEVKVSKKVTVPDEDAELPEDGIKPVKQVTKKVPANFQLGKVIATPNTERKVTVAQVGETVVYRTRSVEDFDLIKGTKLVRFFDIIGLWYND